MSQVTLSLETIGQLDDGAAGLIINKALAEACRDLDDRGGDKKERKVNILISMKRRENGMAEIHAEASVTMPKLRTASTVALVKQDGDQTRMLFQSHCPDDPHQTTIHDQIDRQRAATGERGVDE